MTQFFGDALTSSLNDALVSAVRVVAVALVGAVVVLFLALLAMIGLWDEAHATDDATDDKQDEQHDEAETTEDAGCAISPISPSMRLESALGAPLPSSVVAAALIDDWRNRQHGREAQG